MEKWIEFIIWGLVLVSAIQHDAVAIQPRSRCCACGYAVYKMNFKGTWSRRSHPKDFPTEESKLAQMHWSNVVGASHSEAYSIWNYGEYASSSVKQICEYGYASILKRDMKRASDKIRTVIKTTSMWRDVDGERSAVFTVNRGQHLLSLLTMVGPSPDWCVGVSQLDLCQKDCKWSDEIEVDLYPWDAGTDSGISYFSRNQETKPPDVIRNITHKFPNDPASPFYSNEPMKPLAKLTLTKTKDVCASDRGAPVSVHSPSTDELVDMMKKKMMISKKMEMEKCATSDWTKWGVCSSRCGPGERVRRRILKNPEIRPSMCNVVLMEKESCVGDCSKKRRRQKELPDDFVVRHQEEKYMMDDVCAVTPWSDWSPCSVSCGMGIRERWRMFLRKSLKTKRCNIQLMQKDLCRAEITDCRKALMMLNYTAICSLPMMVGPCTGEFERYYFNKATDTCDTFSYGGCRGNGNLFLTKRSCTEACVDKVRMEKIQSEIDFDNLDAFLSDEEVMMMKKKMMNNELTEDDMMMMKKKKMMMESGDDDDNGGMMKKKLMMEKQTEEENEMKKKQMMEEALAKQEMMLKEKMMEEQKEEMMRKQQLMEKEELMKKLQMMENSESLTKQQMMEKGDIMQKLEMIEKQEMMWKQEMMEKEELRRKQEMMAKEEMLRKQEMMEKEEMLRKQEMMEKEEMLGKREMMEKAEMLRKQEMMEKEEMLRKQEMMEKEEMLRKQEMMEKEEMLRKQEMMEKEEMLRKQEIMEKEDMLRKQEMMEKEEMLRKQEMMEKEEMLRKEEMMEKEEMRRKQEMMEKEKQEMMRKQQKLEKEMNKKKLMNQNKGDDGKKNNDDSDDDSKNEIMSKKKMKLISGMPNKKLFMLKKKLSKGDQVVDSMTIKKKDKEFKKMIRMEIKRRKKLKKERKRKKRMKKNGKGPVDCLVTPWSDWTKCSLTCGAGVMSKSRMIKVHSLRGGKACPKTLVKEKACRMSKCPIDCIMGEWSDWTACSRTCGENAIQIRKRKIIQKPKWKGTVCGVKRMKRFCNLPMCPN